MKNIPPPSHHPPVPALWRIKGMRLERNHPEKVNHFNMSKALRGFQWVLFLRERQRHGQLSCFKRLWQALILNITSDKMWWTLTFRLLVNSYLSLKYFIISMSSNSHPSSLSFRRDMIFHSIFSLGQNWRCDLSWDHHKEQQKVQPWAELISPQGNYTRKGIKQMIKAKSHCKHIIPRVSWSALPELRILLKSALGQT